MDLCLPPFGAKASEGGRAAKVNKRFATALRSSHRSTCFIHRSVRRIDDRRPAHRLASQTTRGFSRVCGSTATVIEPREGISRTPGLSADTIRQGCRRSWSLNRLFHSRACVCRFGVMSIFIPLPPRSSIANPTSCNVASPLSPAKKAASPSFPRTLSAYCNAL